MVLLLVFKQLTRDLFAIAKFLYSTVLTWIQHIASVRILMIARKFLEARIGGELLPQSSIVIRSSTEGLCSLILISSTIRESSSLSFQILAPNFHVFSLSHYLDL